MSPGSPLRPRGFALAMPASAAWSRAMWAFIFVMKSPGQTTFVEMCRLPSALARPTLRWLTAALLALYAQAATGLSWDCGRKAATEAMLTTRAGSPGRPAAASSFASFCVRLKTPRTFRSKMRGHALSGYSSNLPPQVAPALFTRMCNRSSRLAMKSAAAWHPAASLRSEAKGTTSPPEALASSLSSAAQASQESSLREVM
mmetsp:Transcript_14436/g.45478  ORF Transcript_14436/g.45478 Transcript_14436/m.45478 type:complete len:201 (-) Transcript_14436:277-879(-)